MTLLLLTDYSFDEYFAATTETTKTTPRGGSRTPATVKMEHFVIIVNG